MSRKGPVDDDLGMVELNAFHRFWENCTKHYCYRVIKLSLNLFPRVDKHIFQAQ